MASRTAATTAMMAKSQSVPGLMALGTTMPRADGHRKTVTLTYKGDQAVDVQKTQVPSPEAYKLASQMIGPGWRWKDQPIRDRTGGEAGPVNMQHPRIAPAWLKHDKQVLRFYAFFQESVNERAEENSRYRHCIINYYMEDGTMNINEPKVENSGIVQGQLIKRHRIPKADGLGLLGPDDIRIGEQVEIYGRVFYITGCDRFTRWFYEENGVELLPDEGHPEDQWTQTYKVRKTYEMAGKPLSRLVVEGKKLVEVLLGQPPVDRKLVQFLENDRKVLRFQGYWDDPTPYGMRIYFIVHYYLADNTIEVNEAHCRNSGRDGFPVFFKRGKLNKNYHINAYPGMLEPDEDPYMPEDLIVGESISILGRKVVLYNCDDFTRSFYEAYLGIDQRERAIDVSDAPKRHLVLNYPPHNGIGLDEDSLMNCKALAPKAAKVDLVRLMTLSGEILRYEAKLANNQHEDEIRKFIIGVFPADFKVAVWEVQQRNSGFTAGKFREKARFKNPATGKYFQLEDFYVGQTVTISAQPFEILRADEHTLQYMENNPQLYPYADVLAVARKVLPLRDHPEMQDPSGIDPDKLKDLTDAAGIDLVDHEIITLLRRFPVDELVGIPRVAGRKVFEILGN
mmetsp:Transcript_50377/g.93171  ORF Transcript_50377/g.93171 Transcript_50377/m.93171 type:complete len:623 (+) Transcript_50377:87-1955(+)